MVLLIDFYLPPFLCRYNTSTCRTHFTSYQVKSYRPDVLNEIDYQILITSEANALLPDMLMCYQSTFLIMSLTYNKSM